MALLLCGEWPLTSVGRNFRPSLLHLYYTTFCGICQEVFQKFFEKVTQTHHYCNNDFLIGAVGIPRPSWHLYYTTKLAVCQEVFEKIFWKILIKSDVFAISYDVTLHPKIKTISATSMPQCLALFFRLCQREGKAVLNNSSCDKILMFHNKDNHTVISFLHLYYTTPHRKSQPLLWKNLA